MKIKIDVTNKVLQVEDTVPLGELIEVFDTLFPDGAWKHYTLEPFVSKEWYNPITISPGTSPYVYRTISGEATSGSLTISNLNTRSANSTATMVDGKNSTYCIDYKQ